MPPTTVVFQPEGRRTKIDAREDLLDAARRCGVGVEDLCDGRGTCGKCKVIVRRGREFVGASDEASAELSDEDRRRGVVLACRTHVTGEGAVILEIPAEAQRSQQRLQTSGFMPPFRPAPSIRTVALRTATPEGIRRAGYVLDRTALAELREKGAPSPKGGRGVLWRDRRILAVLGRSARPLGMAFDIGSTKVAGFLMDLASGRTLETASAPNPQISHGEDIMSRLSFSMQSRANEGILHDEIIECLNGLITRACALAKVRADSVFQITAVGNTAMHHLFLGLPTEGLARAPYYPASTKAEERRAADLGLRVHPAARVTVPPVVAAFVGSDLVAGVLATRMHRARGLRVFIDVGTNTEICAGDRERLVACSTPSGPAFEGAHIRFGMRAADGAVERVSIDPDSLEPSIRTIGKMKPRGLCGSALIDLIADLSLTGLISPQGRFRKVESPWVTDRGYIVVRAENTSIGQDILLMQEDIGQLQLAKAAVHTGIDIILSELKASPSDIQALYVAGAFGTYIAPESARAAGMIPDIALDRVRFVGNTAGSGARLVLASRRERQEMARLARTIAHLSLAGDPRFSIAFASSLPIPHRDLNRFPSVTPRRGASSPPGG